MVQDQIWVHKCLRCGNIWIAKRSKQARSKSWRCPKCKGIGLYIHEENESYYGKSTAMGRLMSR